MLNFDNHPNMQWVNYNASLPFMSSIPIHLKVLFFFLLGASLAHFLRLRLLPTRQTGDRRSAPNVYPCCYALNFIDVTLMDKLDAPVRLLWCFCCCCCCLCRLRIQPCCLLRPTEMKRCFWSRQRSSHKHPASYIISCTVLCKCVFFPLCVCVHLRHIFHLPRRAPADSSLRLASRCSASLTCNNSRPAGIRRGPISTSTSTFSFSSSFCSSLSFISRPGPRGLHSAAGVTVCVSAHACMDAYVPLFANPAKGLAHWAMFSVTCGRQEKGRGGRERFS